MIGLIAGDCAGDGFEISRWSGGSFEEAFCSSYSKEPYRPKRLAERARDFPLFRDFTLISDDSVQSIAVMEWLLRGGKLREILLDYYKRYPDCGYGWLFAKWASSGGIGHSGSVGNGAAMRVAPVSYVARTYEEAIELARESSKVTHLVEHAIRGAEAIAAATFLARAGIEKVTLVNRVAEQFGYSVSNSLDQVRLDRMGPDYKNSSACEDTVPVALRAVLEATSYEEAIRFSISVGGDADTVAAMAGAVSEAIWGVPQWIREEALVRLDPPMRSILAEFEARFSGSALH